MPIQFGYYCWAIGTIESLRWLQFCRIIFCTFIIAMISVQTTAIGGAELIQAPLFFSARPRSIPIRNRSVYFQPSEKIHAMRFEVWCHFMYIRAVYDTSTSFLITFTPFHQRLHSIIFSSPCRRKISIISTATTTAVTMPALRTPQLKQLHASFGAEITGLNFANGVTIDGQKMILDAVIKVGS